MKVISAWNKMLAHVHEDEERGIHLEVTTIECAFGIDDDQANVPLEEGILVELLQSLAY